MVRPRSLQARSSAGWAAEGTPKQATVPGTQDRASEQAQICRSRKAGKSGGENLAVTFNCDISVTARTEW